MAKMNPLMETSSQESLPLSQESFMCLMNQLQHPMPNFLYDMTACDISLAAEFPSMEQLPEMPTMPVPEQTAHHSPGTPQQLLIPSSLPASENWPGDYSFTVSFSPQESVKGVSWIYSKIKNKLYVGKDVPCPINFSTRCTMEDNVCIRAMALFSSSDHAADRVHRCVNHSMDEIQKGVFEAEHLVRCESKMACYNTDPVTGRHSVVVPYENPAAGQHFSSYIYKFSCFGSCSGGPNRRPLMLVFTLERGNEVIGRQKVDLKICACPVRDKRLEEQQLLPDKGKHTAVKRKDPFASGSLTPDSVTSCLPVKKIPPKIDGHYHIKVRDLKCYEFLKEMKRYFYMMRHVRTLTPNDLRFIVYSSLSSEEEKE